MDRRTLDAILMIAASWGFAVTFIKVIAASGMHPLAIAAMRSALCAIALGLWFVLQRRHLVRDRTMLRHMLVLGILNGLIPNAMIALALTRIDSAPAAMVQATIPAIVGLLAGTFMPAERLRLSQIAGFVASFFGVFIIVGPSNALAGNATFLGTLTMLGAAFSYG